MVLLLTLLACPGGGKDSDTAGSSGNCGGSPSITDFNATDASDTVTWYVETDQPTGSVELTIIETGDPTFNCGPQSLECGVWREDHDAFTVAGSGSSGGTCGERKELTLGLKNDFKQQVNNESTLFDSTEFGSVTVLITVTDQNGDYADCVVFGDSPAYFKDLCTNVQ